MLEMNKHTRLENSINNSGISPTMPALSSQHVTGLEKGLAALIIFLLQGKMQLCLRVFKPIQ